MEAKEFIKNWVITVGLKIGVVSVEYEFQKFEETHFLKIVPTKIVDEDDYNTILSKFIIDFESKFVGDMLCLIGDTSLTKLENAVELCLQAVPKPFKTIMGKEKLNAATIMAPNDLIIPTNSKIILTDENKLDKLLPKETPLAYLTEERYAMAA